MASRKSDESDSSGSESDSSEYFGRFYVRRDGDLVELSKADSLQIRTKNADFRLLKYAKYSSVSQKHIFNFFMMFPGGTAYQLELEFDDFMCIHRGFTSSGDNTGLCLCGKITQPSSAQPVAE